MKFPPQKHLRLRFNTKRESISPSLHRNGVLKGLKRLTRVQCSWLCIFPSTIFGNPRCRINSKLAHVSCFFVHFFAVTARHYVKLPNLTFSGRQKNKTTTFCFFFWTLIQSLDLLTFANIRRKELDGISAIQVLSSANRPLPRSKNPHFQNEAKCTTFLVEMSFICMRMKNHFHFKDWVPSLVLIQRPGGTQKWPIHFFSVVFVAVKFDWSDRSFLLGSKYGTLKMKIQEHRKKIYMRVTRFNPFWVSSLH